MDLNRVVEVLVLARESKSLVVLLDVPVGMSVKTMFRSASSRLLESLQKVVTFSLIS